VPASSHWKFGKGDFERVAFPAFTLLFLWIGKRILERVHDTYALEVVLSLVVAWALIRIATYVLGHIIPEGGFQRAVIRIVAWVAWLVVILHVVGLLPEVLDALESHGISIGKNKSQITLLDVLKGFAALFLAITVALWISRVTESRIMSAESMEMTTRVVITKVVRITVLFAAILIGLPLSGVDITTLSIFTGAIGVGLGFGLQKIVSNYISGFIVLLDHSIRIGDVVTVDGRKGEVKAIETRYTVIKGGDGVESIVPNETLITNSVQHHTYSDPRVSVVVNATITYESDYDKACQILADVARRQDRVIADPPATARLKGLGDNGIELEITVWISDPAMGESDLKSELLKQVLRAFRDAGIEIARPRRDVRMATVEMGKSHSTSST
jgi:small-conductance mechanosensitive channel